MFDKINYSGPFLATLLIVFLSGCDFEDPVPDPGEEEFITRLTIRLNSSDMGEDIIIEANDPSGDGLNLQIDSLTLVANTIYTGSISVRDDINGQDITLEVEEEADDHQFFYIPGGDANARIVVTITDQDRNALPVGLEFTLTVSDGPVASGTFRVVLSHFDEVSKDGVSMGDESDIDVTFPVKISMP